MGTRKLIIYAGFAGMNPLLEAILTESKEQVQSLTSKIPLDDQENLLGQSAVHLAVYRPHHLDLLLNIGANINARDKYGITPLMYAAAIGNHEIAIRLLEFGADPFLTACRNQSFLQITLAQNRPNTFIAILKHIRQYPATSKFPFRDLLALGLAALIYERYHISGDEPITVQALLEWGANPDVLCFDHRGHLTGTLLHHIRDIPMVKSIILHGFTRFNYPDHAGAHALHSTCVRPNPTLMELLLDGGSSVNHQNREGDTTLHMVSQHLKFDIMATADTKHESYEERARVIDCIKLLLRRGADSCLGDSCQCACSRSGCTPSNRLLKEHFMTSSCRKDIWALEFYSAVEEVCGFEKAKKCLLDMLRLVKFEELEITHTCRQESFFFTSLNGDTAIEQEEVEEIFDEERVTIQDLEDDMLLIEQLPRDELEQVLLDALLRRKWDRELEVRSLTAYGENTVNGLRSHNCRFESNC